jgi:hypothetical protein
MKELGILFSAPMVRALLDGTKTQTRRACKPANEHALSYVVGPGEERSDLAAGWFGDEEGDLLFRCPYGKPGDRLWVRETWRHTAGSLGEARAITEDITSGTAVDWRATYIENCIRDLGFTQDDAEMADSFETWRPSIHMPRWASRILLEITGVDVERLQDISEADAKSEGIDMQAARTAISSIGMREIAGPVAEFSVLWDSVNGAGSWDTNPWVWVVEFRRIER